MDNLYDSRFVVNSNNKITSINLDVKQKEGIIKSKVVSNNNIHT